MILGVCVRPIEDNRLATTTPMNPINPTHNTNQQKDVVEVNPNK